MALSARQLAAFTDIVDLYEPAAFTKTSKRVTGIGGVSATATYEDVRCHVQPSIEATVKGPLGRQDYDVVDTMDVLRLDIEQDIGAGWYVLMKTPDHPENGTWYITQGAPRNYSRRAGERVLYMAKTTTAPGVS